MGKKKRTTLPKDFREILERGNLTEIYSVFETCDVNAVGGYGKETAISFDLCPDEVVVWLVENGANLSAKNTWGRTALHNRVGSRRSSIKVLLNLGMDISLLDNYGNTALHSAVDSHNPESTKILIEHGSNVNSINNEGFTPLELGLRSCRNIDIENTVEITKMLVNAGAQKTSKCKEFIENIGKTFEFHREGFNKDSVQSVSNALDEMYLFFDVTPIQRLKKYDGTSPIIAISSTWQKQHEELWSLLVPSSGHAETIQGELIRISGKISNEIEGNGAINWDKEYIKMAESFLVLLEKGNRLSSEEIMEAGNIIKSIKNIDGRSQQLAKMAVAWVKMNPSPLILDEPNYKR